MNLWVEEATGDVLFLMSRTDTWDEVGRLLKIGRIRISFDPNPFGDFTVCTCFQFHFNCSPFLKNCIYIQVL